MCFEPDARPPIPPIAGGATDARDLVLTSSDGTRWEAGVWLYRHNGSLGMEVEPPLTLTIN